MTHALQRRLMMIAVAGLLAGCGGAGTGTAPAPTRLLAKAASVEVRTFPGNRVDYTIAASPDGSRSVTSVAGETVLVAASARMRFAVVSLAWPIHSAWVPAFAGTTFHT